MASKLKNFVNKVRGSGSVESSSVDCSSLDSSASVRRVGAKAKAASPTEGLFEAAASDRPAGSNKTPCVNPVEVSAGSGMLPAPATLSDISGLIAAAHNNLRKDLDESFVVILRPLQSKVDEMYKRIASQEEQIAAITLDNKSLADKLMRIQNSADEEANSMRSAITALEKKVKKLEKKPDKTGDLIQIQGNSTPGTTLTLDMVQDTTERQLKRNNVVLRGLPSSATTSLPDTICSLVPNMEKSMVHSAYAIKPKVSDPTKPQSVLVRAVMTETGKHVLMSQKKNATYNGKPVYIQHDLTKMEQRSRKEVVPKFNDLRKKGHRCYLPRDRIMLDGKVLSDEKITELLQ